MDYLELGCLEHPTISNCSSISLAQINRGYLELYYIPKKHWSTSVRKCIQGTSWQDVLKGEKRIDVFTVTKAKSDWLDLPLQKVTSCRYLLLLGIKLLLQKFDANLAILNPHYLELVYATQVNSAFRAIWLVPQSRDIKYYSPPGGFRVKKMSRETHFIRKWSNFLGIAIKLVLYILKQLFASVSVNGGGYLPRQSGSVNIHRYSPPLLRIIVNYFSLPLRVRDSGVLLYNVLINIIIW